MFEEDVISSAIQLKKLVSESRFLVIGGAGSIGQAVINRVRPGLSGVGSIIFRGEEDIMHGPMASVDFYNNVIAPYKGALEEWFVANKSLYVYFMTIFITVWAVLFPKTKVAWIAFKELPEPPEELKLALNYKA